MSNWNWTTNSCGCGCTTRYKKGEPGIQGKPGIQGPPGGVSSVDYYTAHAGGGQSGATNLISSQNIVNVAATLGDSVKLMPAIKNSIQQVRNYGAFSINVFPQSGDQIDSLGANTPYALAAGSIVEFACAVNGTYIS